MRATVERFFSHPETLPRKAAPAEIDALCAAKIVAYERGFEQLAVAGAQYGWRLDLSEIAAIWRAGRIIRAAPAVRRTCCSACATILARIPTEGSTSRVRSTPAGGKTAPMGRRGPFFPLAMCASG